MSQAENAKQAKRIAVTGAGGKLGKETVRRLSESGYELFLIDQIDLEEWGYSSMRVNLQNFGQTLDALSSKGQDVYASTVPEAFDAIVHLASIPHPRVIPDTAEFADNMLATFNVFESARRLGIKNVIWAASEVGTGVPYDAWEPPYVPVDEDYPHRGISTYAMTKVLGEELATQYCLNNPDMRITCLRYSHINDLEDYKQFESWQDDPTQRLWNMWTYIDIRDAAQAVECAIQYDERGMETFFITNDETVMRTPTQELLDRYYPNVKQNKTFSGNEVVLSNAKAKRVLGFQPQHHWYDET